jgi:glycosyltransferase involved in cell wall biosynthesis
MANPSVCATLIVKNEEAHLHNCLGSLATRVDEILVVDTGSSDETVPIAKSFGARVLNFDWIDDFSAARNFGLTFCRTDWAFYIDADERLNPSASAAIGYYLQPDWIGANVLLRPKRNFTRYKLARLFRVDPKLRFDGTIHETIVPALEGAALNGDGHIGTTTIELDHLGYDGDQSHKHQRNLPLLYSAIRLDPARVYLWFHLTETLLALGRDEEAELAGQKGLALAEFDQTAKNRVDSSLICQMLSTAMLRRGEDPLSLLNRGLRLHPGNHGLRLALAQRHFNAGKYEAAIRITRALQRINPKSLVPDLIAYDLEIFGRYALELEVASLVKLGRLADAAKLLA